MRYFQPLIASLAITMAFQTYANAQQCTAHYTFDGNISDSSSAGLSAFLADATRAASSVEFAEGKFGQALVLDGDTVLRLPIDLTFESCPEVTITAWIKVPAPLDKGTMFVIGSGSGNTPGLSISGSRLTARGSANGISQDDVFYGSPEWIFVAAVYDSTEGTFRLHWRHRNKPKTLGSIATAADSIWLGAQTQDSKYVAKGILVDDLRIYPQALTVENIAEIREGQASTPGDAAQFASSSGAEGGACSAHEQCGTGFYCAFDGTCHPDRHAPMQDIEILELENQGTVGMVLPTLPAEDDNSSATDDFSEPPRGFSPYPVGEPTVTEYSGSIGSIARTLDYGSGTRFLTEIEWQESNDRPCMLIARGHDYGVDAGEPPQGWPRIDFECSGFGLFGTSFKTVTTSITRPIHAIHVCNNGRNAKRRLKGIRVYGARINADGTTTDGGTSDEEVLPNCNDWGTYQKCPANQVATGVVVLASEDGSGDRAGITALKLVCRAIGVD